MQLTTPETIISALGWRYATKQFDPAKHLTAEQLNVLLEAAHLTASSYGLQPWKFIVVTNMEKRTALRAAGYDQPQITDASHLIVLAAQTTMAAEQIERYVAFTATERGIDPALLAGYKQMMLGDVTSRSAAEVAAWNARQVYIALGTLLETAALLQIDACPMEGFDNDAADTILGLKAHGLTSLVLLPVGYRAATDASAQAKKVRYPLNEIVMTID